MVVHTEDAIITDSTVMGPQWLHIITFLAHPCVPTLQLSYRHMTILKQIRDIRRWILNSRLLSGFKRCLVQLVRRL